MNKQKFQTGKVITVALAHSLHDVYSSFLAPILPLLIDKLGISLSTAGFLSMIGRIPALLNPLVGLAADKLRVRYLLILAPSVTATSMSLLGVAPSVTVIIILLFVMGIGASMFHVPAPVIMKQVSGNRVGKGMSFFMLGGEIARGLSPLVILGAVSLWGLEGTYKLIPFGLFASAILYFKLKDIEIKQNGNDYGKQEGVKQTLKEITPLFISIIGATFFIALLRGSLTAFLPTYITMKGKSLWSGGIALSALQISGALGTYLSGTLSDKFGRRKTLLIVGIVSSLLMWLFIISDDFWSIPILILLGLFVFGTTPVMLAIVNDNTSSRPSFINGIYITINFVIGGGSVLLVGLLGDLYGLETTYKITATLALLSVPFILKIEK